MTHTLAAGPNTFDLDALIAAAPRDGYPGALFRWADSLHRVALADLDDVSKLRVAPYLAQLKFTLAMGGVG